jgi:hypothetical protein
LVHTPTRFLYSEYVKNKTEASKALKDILEDLIKTKKPPPTLLISDAGTEFVNKTLQSFFDQNNINHVAVSKNAGEIATAMSIVERVNRTVRELIERYITLSGQNGK